MGKKKKQKVFKKILSLLGSFVFVLFKSIKEVPGQIKRYVLAFFAFLLAVICFFSFFDLAGRAGEIIRDNLFSFLGHTFYFLPVFFILIGLAFLFSSRKHIWLVFFIGFLLLLIFSALLQIIALPMIEGGRIGGIETEPMVNFFGELVSFFAFLSAGFFLSLSLWHIFKISLFEKEEGKDFKGRMKQFFSSPKLKVLQIEPGEHSSKRAPASKEEPDEEKGPSPNIVSTVRKGILPPLSLLEETKDEARASNLKQGAEIIKQTFKNFDMEVQMVGANVGPTVTQYTLKPPRGVRLTKIIALSNNLALALAAHPVRIEAPIPGKSLVGVEVPNRRRGTVKLKELLSSNDFKREKLALGICLGRDVSGNPVFEDLARLPHLLIAGATGTGKTAFLNSLILSFLYQRTPYQLRLILIDPKKVEFSSLSHLPHLLCPVVSSADKTVGALTWVAEEMERRFNLLSTEDTRNIYSYNQKVAKKSNKDPLPFIVLVIDELADLILAKGRDMESKIVRIAQKARAVGIHLVVATQRPSVEVITGLIKANITSRISFQLPTQVDSRTILDMAGAEKLLGAGDMLFVSPRWMKPRRIQGPYVSDKELDRVITWIETNTADQVPDIGAMSERLNAFLEESFGAVDVIDGMEKDPLYEQAKEVVIRAGKGSASLLQRRLQVGYVRAARILDMLQAEGIVGSSRDGKPRRVLIKGEDLIDEREDGFFEEDD